MAKYKILHLETNDFVDLIVDGIRISSWNSKLKAYNDLIYAILSHNDYLKSYEPKSASYIKNLIYYPDFLIVKIYGNKEGKIKQPNNNK